MWNPPDPNDTVAKAIKEGLISANDEKNMVAALEIMCRPMLARPGRGGRYGHTQIMEHIAETYKKLELADIVAPLAAVKKAFVVERDYIFKGHSISGAESKRLLKKHRAVVKARYERRFNEVLNTKRITMHHAGINANRINVLVPPEMVHQLRALQTLAAFKVQ